MPTNLTILPVGTSLHVALTDLHVEQTDAAVADATVTAWIEDLTDGTTVEDSEIELDALGGGDYEGLIPGTLALARGRQYGVRVKAVAGSVTGTPQITLGRDGLPAEYMRFDE